MYKGILKATLIAFSMAIMIHVFTMVVLSTNYKTKTCIGDLDLLIHVDQFDSLVYLANLGDSKTKLEELLEDRYQDNVDFIAAVDKEIWSEKRLDSNFLAISMQFSTSNFMTFDVDIKAGTLFYGESWSSSYIWILNKWYRIRHELKGVS